MKSQEILLKLEESQENFRNIIIQMISVVPNCGVILMSKCHLSSLKHKHAV